MLPPDATPIPDCTHDEFDRQVETLLAKGYPALSGLSTEMFVAHCERLRTRVARTMRRSPDCSAGFIPFLLVAATVPAARAMARVKRSGKTGIVRMQPVTPEDFAPIAEVGIPASPVYVLLDFDRGDAYRNVRPEDALRGIRQDQRFPLTIAEGIAALTHFPEILIKNQCFSLSGSRREDQRVPAVWLSEGRPKLGWCWDRNPHTWLGSASCAGRQAAISQRGNPAPLPPGDLSLATTRAGRKRA